MKTRGENAQSFFTTVRDDLVKIPLTFFPRRRITKCIVKIGGVANRRTDKRSFLFGVIIITTKKRSVTHCRSDKTSFTFFLPYLRFSRDSKDVTDPLTNIPLDVSRRSMISTATPVSLQHCTVHHTPRCVRYVLFSTPSRGVKYNCKNKTDV